jgi:CDP-diacylglycerol--inositol 3-phosphatidyltransferase
MATLTFPIFLLKNIINVVQLWKASKILVGVDLAERAAARAAALKKAEAPEEKPARTS